MSLEDRVIVLEQQIEAIRQAFKQLVTTKTFDSRIGYLAGVLKELISGGRESTAGAFEDDSPGRPMDNTPFPAGAKASAGGVAGPPSPPPSGQGVPPPADAVQEDLTPNAGSRMGMNAAPIPQGKVRV